MEASSRSRLPLNRRTEPTTSAAKKKNPTVSSTPTSPPGIQGGEAVDAAAALNVAVDDTGDSAKEAALKRLNLVRPGGSLCIEWQTGMWLYEKKNTSNMKNDCDGKIPVRALVRIEKIVPLSPLTSLHWC